MSELISIIVTSYNHAEYLKQRLDTLINQTYKNKEIIVIDDSSTDSSQEILENYTNTPGIQLIYLSKNMGYAYVCNYGVSLACGEYIMFAECDDFNEPNHIETLYKNIRSSEEIGVVYSRSKIVDSKGKVFGDDFRGNPISFRKYCSKDILIPRRKMQRFLLNSCVIPNMSAVLFRRKYFSAVRGFSQSFKVCADWDFWCRMAQICDFFYVTDALNNFRRHATTVRTTFGIEPQFFEIFKLLHNAMPKIDLNKTERIFFEINLGYMFAHEALFSYKGKIRNVAFILKQGCKFGKAFFFLFLLGLIRSFMELLCFKVKRVYKSLTRIMCRTKIGYE